MLRHFQHQTRLAALHFEGVENRRQLTVKLDVDDGADHSDDLAGGSDGGRLGGSLTVDIFGVDGGALASTSGEAVAFSSSMILGVVSPCSRTLAASATSCPLIEAATSAMIFKSGSPSLGKSCLRDRPPALRER